MHVLLTTCCSSDMAFVVIRILCFTCYHCSTHLLESWIALLKEPGARLKPFFKTESSNLKRRNCTVRTSNSADLVSKRAGSEVEQNSKCGVSVLHKPLCMRVTEYMLPISFPMMSSLRARILPRGFHFKSVSKPTKRNSRRWMLRCIVRFF